MMGRFITVVTGWFGVKLAGVKAGFIWRVAHQIKRFTLRFVLKSILFALSIFEAGAADRETPGSSRIIALAQSSYDSVGAGPGLHSGESMRAATLRVETW